MTTKNSASLDTDPETTSQQVDDHYEMVESLLPACIDVIGREYDLIAGDGLSPKPSPEWIRTAVDLAEGVACEFRTRRDFAESGVAAGKIPYFNTSVSRLMFGSGIKDDMPPLPKMPALTTWTDGMDYKSGKFNLTIGKAKTRWQRFKRSIFGDGKVS